MDRFSNRNFFSRFSESSRQLVKVGETKIPSAPSPDFSTTFPLFKMKIGPVVSAPQSVTDGRTDGRTDIFSRWHILDQGVPRITGNPKSQNRKFARSPNFPYYYIKTHVYSVYSVFYSSRKVKSNLELASYKYSMIVAKYWPTTLFAGSSCSEISK